jgi:hypothetical protein
MCGTCDSVQFAAVEGSRIEKNANNERSPIGVTPNENLRVVN